MPANLPPQYLEAEKRYRLAKAVPDKIKALEEMLAIIPKHKGTEKLRADLKRRMSKLRAEAQKKSGPGRRGYAFHVEREGAGQVVLVGLPNVGKSAILDRLTNALPEVAEYPFTTRKPLPGMMEFGDIQIQLVDLPAVSPEYTEPWVSGIIRNADLALLVIDLSGEDPLEQIEVVKGELEQQWKIHLVGSGEEGDPGEVGRVSKKTLIVGNKNDGKRASENYTILRDLYGERFPTISISARDGVNLEELRRRIYDLLQIMRVYTKPPGKEPSFSNPVVLPKGSTILDVAASVHKDFTQKLKFARIWGGGKYEGQKVQRDYVVQDGDVIELHI